MSSTSATALLQALRSNSANFVNGFYEIKDVSVVRVLQALTP